MGHTHFNCTYTGSEDYYLNKVIKKELVYSRGYTNDNHSFDHWGNVTFRGTLDPIFDSDIGTYMKDKAISPELTKL